VLDLSKSVGHCEVSRTYLVFGDIEGKLDVLRVECRQMRPQRPHPLTESFPIRCAIDQKKRTAIIKFDKQG